MADDRHLEIFTPYFCEISFELDEILYGEADWDYNETYLSLKPEILKSDMTDGRHSGKYIFTITAPNFTNAQYPTTMAVKRLWISKIQDGGICTGTYYTW